MTSTAEQLLRVKPFSMAKSAVRMRRWREKNRERYLLHQREYRARTGYNREWMRRKRANSPKVIRPLTDRYVNETLTRRSRVLRGRTMPPELIAVEKALLQLKRLLWRNQKTSTNSATNSSTPSIG